MPPPTTGETGMRIETNSFAVRPSLLPYMRSLRMGEGMKEEDLPLRKTSGTWTGRAVVDAVAAFRREHGRWPSAGARDPQERSLGIWLSRQRVELANGRLNEVHEAALDRV